MDGEIEVQELVFQELSKDMVVPDGEIFFPNREPPNATNMPTAEPLALVAYKSTTKSNPSIFPSKRVAPLFQDLPTYTHALRDSLLLSPPPFSSRRRSATGDLARRRELKGSPINGASVRTPPTTEPTVTAPTQSFALSRTIALSPSQEPAKSTFSTVVDRVRASANPKSARLTSARRDAKRVPPSVQEAYDAADPFSTNGDSFYSPSFVHSSDINNIGLYMTPDSSKYKKRTEPKLRRKNSRHDLRTAEAKMYKMKTTLYDMSIYGVPTKDNSKPKSSKPRTKKNSSSISSIYKEPSPGLESLPRSASIVESTSRSGSGNDPLALLSYVYLTKFCTDLATLPSVRLTCADEGVPIGKIVYSQRETDDVNDIYSESTFVVADDPFTKDVRIALPVGVPPGDLYNFDVYAPSRSYGSKVTNVRPVSLSKSPKSEAEELRRLSANVSAYAAEVFPFSLNADPLSSSSEDDFSSTEDVPHLRAILDGMDFSPLLLPCFIPTSIPASISSLDLDYHPEPLSCGPPEFDSPATIAPISVHNYELVPVSRSTDPPAVIIKSRSEAKLSLTGADGYSIAMASDPVSFPSAIPSGNEAVCDFNVNMAPASTPHGRENRSLPVTQPGADPSVATITLDPEKPPSSSPPGTTQCEPPQTCPNLEPSSVVTVSGGLGPTEVARPFGTNLASVVDTYSQNLGVECLNETAAPTTEGSPPSGRFLQAESHSSRSRNLKDGNIEPLSRRVGIYGSLPRQRNSTTSRRSSNLAGRPLEHTCNQTRAIVLERHRASVLYSASHRRPGLRGLRLPQRVALREQNTEVGAPTLSTDSTPDTTLVSTSLDDAKEPPLSEADQNRNSLDALIALIDSDMKVSSNSGNLSAPSFQKSSSSQYSIQWGVAF